MHSGSSNRVLQIYVSMLEVIVETGNNLPLLRAKRNRRSCQFLDLGEHC